MSISALDTTDLLLVFRRLRSPEMRALLAGTHNGPLYEAEIDAIAEHLEADADGGAPLAAELRAEDAHHDAFGNFVHLQLESYKQLAPVPEFEDLAALAAEMQARTIDSRSRTRVGFGEQAAFTGRLGQRMDALRPDLGEFPVARGGDLAAMTDRFIESGGRMSDLLARRADILAERAQQRGDGGTNLRGQAIALLGELRGQLQNEARRRVDLPADLDGRVFGLLDERIARRAERARSKSKGDAGAERSPVEPRD